MYRMGLPCFIRIHKRNYKLPICNYGYSLGMPKRTSFLSKKILSSKELEIQPPVIF